MNYTCMYVTKRPFSFLFLSHVPQTMKSSIVKSLKHTRKKKNKRKIVSQVKSAQTLNIDLYKYNLQSLFSNLNRFFILL